MVTWCDNNQPKLNINRTNQLVLDYKTTNMEVARKKVLSLKHGSFTHTHTFNLEAHIYTIISVSWWTPRIQNDHM